MPPRRKVIIAAEELHEMYWNFRKPTRQIADEYGIAPETVRRLMIKYNIQRRNRYEATLRYLRKPFSENTSEKAYLLGLRAGDIHARKRSTNTIGVNVTTTHPAMYKLLKKTFGEYGRVKKYPVKGQLGYEWYVYCDLDMSFEFLVEKPTDVLNDENFYAFLAAYVDSEGSWTFSKKKNKIEFHFWIKSQDVNLLNRIRKILEKRGYHPRLSLIEKGLQRCENLSHGNKTEIKCLKDYWQLRICRQGEILSLAEKLLPFARHDEKRKRMQLILEAGKRGWSKYGKDIEKLIAQTGHEVKKWVEKAKIEHERKHAFLLSAEINQQTSSFKNQDRFKHATRGS
jgi:intein-encoded DNA endonuclease-like protein